MKTEQIAGLISNATSFMDIYICIMDIHDMKLWMGKYSLKDGVVLICSYAYIFINVYYSNVFENNVFCEEF